MIPKFRAHDGASGRMYDTHEVGVFDGKIWIDDEDFEGWTANNDLTLMQSTGLFDKNGVEIFEGDFLKNKDKPDTILICKKSDLQASFRACSTNGMISLALWHDESRDWTVIGNIHEHPHLVEVAYDQ